MALHSARVVLLDADGTLDSDILSVTVAQTNTVTPGTPADVTNTGTTSDVQLVFDIPQGAKGDVGPAGPAGGIPVSLPNEAVDLNTLSSAGAYYIASGATDLPGNASSGSGILMVFTNADSLLVQYYIDASGSTAYRTSGDTGSTWSAWAIPPVTFGTTAGTSAQGNDPRIVEATHYSRGFLIGGM